MQPVLIALAIGLWVGWVVVGWLLRQNVRGAAKLERMLDELGEKVEKP